MLLIKWSPLSPNQWTEMPQAVAGLNVATEITCMYA